MTESEFNDLVDDTLLAIEEAVEDSGADIDFENVAGILTLSFADDSKIIINRQGPVQQIWVAARSGGYHFDYRAETASWHSDSDGRELYELLEHECAAQSGEALRLART